MSGDKAARRGAPGQRRVPRAVRERQIVAVASRAFADRGYRHVSMDEIASAAGVTKPMVYAYFDSKQGLFAACADAAARTLLERVRRAGLEPEAAPDQRLWHGILAVFDFVEENADAWRVLYPSNGGPEGTLGAEARRAQALMGDLLGELIAVNAPDPSATQHAPALGHIFTAATVAAATWWLEHPEEPKHVHALRHMNFVWLGFKDLARGRLWIPDRPASDGDSP